MYHYMSGVRLRGGDVYFSKYEKKYPENNEKITYFKFHCDLTVIRLMKIGGKTMGVWSMGGRGIIILRKIDFFL